MTLINGITVHLSHFLKTNVNYVPNTEQKSAEAVAKKLNGLTLVVEQLAGEDDRLFGSVTNADISAKLEEMDITLDKKQIILPDPIKVLGETKVPIKVGFNVTAEITVNVAPIKTS